MKENPEQAEPLANRVADHWWRLYPSFLLHDTVSAAVNRPFYPGFSREEVEKMMTEDAARRSTIDLQKVRRGMIGYLVCAF